jgi:hypothetical protein
MADLMISELASSVALLLRGSGLVTVAENIQEATPVDPDRKVGQDPIYGPAIGEPKPIVPDDMPGKFGSMPTRFFESSWGHYVSKSRG